MDRLLWIGNNFYMPMASKSASFSDDNPIGQRLRLEMKTQGLSSAELAKRAGVKTSFLYDIISGKSANPSTVKLARVADILGVNLTYLVGGDQRPYPSSSAKSSPTQDYVIIPRITVNIAAGGGATIVMQQHEEERYHFRQTWIREQLGVSPSDLGLLYVRGDSMEPTLLHNDIIMVDTTKKMPTPPGIFVLFDGFGLVAKRLEYIADESLKTLRIISDNPQYSTYERSIEETFIIGRVVWFAREM